MIASYIVYAPLPHAAYSSLFFLRVWLHVLCLSSNLLHQQWIQFFFLCYFRFQNLGIQCVRRREVKDAIQQRINRGINPFSGESWLFFLFPNSGVNVLE